MNFYIDRERAKLEVASDMEPVRGSPGWSRVAYSVSTVTDPRPCLGVIHWEHTSGISYWDALHAGATSLEIEVVLADSGLQFPVWPGAGAAISGGLPEESAQIFKRPYWGPNAATGVNLPDHPYTAVTGSPRNGMTSKWWAHLRKLPPGYHDAHEYALEYLQFQRRRSYQNGTEDGGFGNKQASVSAGESILLYNGVNQAIWKYDAHHMAVQEEAGIWEVSRDPRAYDLVRRLILHAGRWEWYYNDGRLHDNSRVKGWWLAALARAYHMARVCSDEPFMDEIQVFAERALTVIEDRWEMGDRVTPSAQAPDNRHIADCWSDSSWMVAILAHGADLMWRTMSLARAASIRDRALTCIDEVFWRNGTLYVDACSDGSKPEKWIPYVKADGTAKWIAQAMIQCGRASSPVLRWIQDWREENDKGLVSWVDYL